MDKAGGVVARYNIIHVIALLIGAGLGIWNNFDSIKNIFNKLFGKKNKTELTIDQVFSCLQKERMKEEEEKDKNQ